MPRNLFGQFRATSSAIIDVTFVPGGITGGTMTIEFQSRGTYEYYDVPFVVFGQFKQSPSWGSYFNAYIKDAGYAYARVS